VLLLWRGCADGRRDRAAVRRVEREGGVGGRRGWGC